MKIKSGLFMLLLMVTTTIAEAAPGSNDPLPTRKEAAAMTPAEREARVSTILKRVEEIKSMDKSSLSKTERKELKKELRTLQKEAKIFGRGGIYLSVGAILVIILILILVL